MRKFHITAVFLSIVVAFAISLPAAGQASAPSSSPQTDPAAAPPPQSEPAAAAPAQSEPAQAQPTQSEPAQGNSTQTQPAESAPSQPAAPSQSGAGASASQGQAQSHAQTNGNEDNPLNLTDEQKTKLRPIVADENQQLDAVRNDSSMSAEQKVQKANQIREEATPKIKAILTQEQLQKLAEMQQRARQQQGAPQNDSQKPQQ